MTEVIIKNVSKSFYKNSSNSYVNAVNNFSLNTNLKEIIAFFGPNGCGKTTLLSIISGLTKPDSGKVLINKKPPELAKIGYVFQDYQSSLLPWRSVLGNIELALEQKKVKASKRKKICLKLLKNAELVEFKDSKPQNLSGGIKQLVAILRAFAFNPDIILMDEPFSALDYSISKKMQLQLQKVWLKKRKIIILVSHDLDEAIFLADKIVLLSKKKARIKKVFPVTLPRPRTFKILQSKEFTNLRNKILKDFDEI
jgi:NitT/TauT family transport system ATP-binding protein